MKHDIISIMILGCLIYIGNLSGAKADNVKYYTNIGENFKKILGYGFLKGNSFSTKSIVSQIGNLVSIIIAILFLISGSQDTIEIFLVLETLNILIVFIVSLFANK